MIEIDLDDTITVFAIVTLIFSIVITLLAGFNLRQLFRKKNEHDLKDQARKEKWTDEKLKEALALEDKYDSQRLKLICIWVLSNMVIVFCGWKFAVGYYANNYEMSPLEVPWLMTIFGVLIWNLERTYRHYEGVFL